MSNTLANDASVPPSFSTNVTVPQNAVQIYAELYASGNSEEEFWYFNVPTEYLSDLPAGFTYGYGPFREVRMLVDGQLAGVAFPYAVIFTGGILPSAWQPITSYGALDLPTYFIDLTPFVPILADGASHNITLDVAGSDPDHGINGNWYVSGNLQVVTDPSGKPTTGRITSYSAEPYAVTNSSLVTEGSNVTITVTGSRHINIEAEVTAGGGATTFVSWSQSLEYSNTQYYLDNYLIQNVAQTSSGTFLSTHNGIPTLVDDFSYPLYINITSLNPDFTTFTANFDHSYVRSSLPAPFLLGSTINERQLAGGIFVETAEGNYGNGTSNNTFTYLDTKGNTYDREVDAAYENITYDHQGGSLYDGDYFTFPLFSSPAPTIAAPRMPGARRTGL